MIDKNKMNINDKLQATSNPTSFCSAQLRGAGKKPNFVSAILHQLPIRPCCKPETSLDKGFTLIETLVVVSSFAIMIGGITGLLMMITRTNKKSETVLNLRRQGDNVISVVNRKVMMGVGFPNGEENDCNGDIATFSVYENFDANNANTREVDLVCQNYDENSAGNISIDNVGLFDDNLGLRVSGCSISCNNNNSISLSFDLEFGQDTEHFSTFILMRNTEK